jgi:hypothetical protein
MVGGWKSGSRRVVVRLHNDAAAAVHGLGGHGQHLRKSFAHGRAPSGRNTAASSDEHNAEGVGGQSHFIYAVLEGRGAE